MVAVSLKKLAAFAFAIASLNLGLLSGSGPPFLTATAEARAERRFKELKDHGVEVSYDRKSTIFLWTK